MPEYCVNCSTELDQDEEGQELCDLCIDDITDATAQIPDIIMLRAAAAARVRRQLDALESLLRIAGYTICQDEAPRNEP